MIFTSIISPFPSAKDFKMVIPLYTKLLCKDFSFPSTARYTDKDILTERDKGHTDWNKNPIVLKVETLDRWSYTQCAFKKIRHSGLLLTNGFCTRFWGCYPIFLETPIPCKFPVLLWVLSVLPPPSELGDHTGFLHILKGLYVFY